MKKRGTSVGIIGFGGNKGKNVLLDALNKRNKGETTVLGAHQSESNLKVLYDGIDKIVKGELK